MDTVIPATFVGPKATFTGVEDPEAHLMAFHTHPILVCVTGDQCAWIMAELHEGICGSHIGGRSLASKAIRAGYYWLTVREDYTRYAQQCKQCQQHADWHKAP